MRTRLRQYPWLSFLTLGAFIVLCGLCGWQLQRLQWKQGQIAQMNEALSAPPILAKNGIDLQSLPEFRQVKVTGKLLHDQALQVQARYYKGNLGFHLVTPLKLPDGTIIFINRGWVPKDYKTNPKVKISRPEGTLNITGIMRKSEQPLYRFLPKNDPATGFWLWPDNAAWAQMAQAANPKATVLPVVIQQTHDAKVDDGFPIAMESHFELRNDHLQYAFTWGSFAVILVVIYFIYTRPKP